MDLVEKILVVIIAFLIAGVVWVKVTDNDTISDLESNIDAYRDSLTVTKLKNGELLYDKKLYVIKSKELEEALAISKKEKSELENKLNSKIAYIAKLESSIRVDSIVVHDTIVKKNDSIEASFSYSDKWMKFNGVTSIFGNKSKTSINNLYINTPLQVGITDDYNIFVKSPNPYIDITSIEGAIIDGSTLKPKQKRFTHGFQIGAGLGYGIIHNKFDIVVYGGYGVNFYVGKK